MEINKVGFNPINTKKSVNNNIAKISCSECDSVSFSGKVKNKSGKIPFRLTSKYQDDFHSTMLQVYIRKFIDLKDKGFEGSELAQAYWGEEKIPDDQIEQQLEYMDKLEKTIKKLDASFEEVIPSMKNTTYYRGVFSSRGNKAIEVVKNAKVGDMIIPDNGYPFFTTDYLDAEDYTSSIDGHHSPDSSVLMKVKIPKGVRI